MLGVLLASLGAVMALLCAVRLRARPSRPGHGPQSTLSRPTVSCGPFPLRAVRIAAAAPANNCLAVTVVDVVDGSPTRRTDLVGDRSDRTMLEQLGEWLAEDATLLLLTDDRGRSELIAPDGTSTGLHTHAA
jgi:hypothetical protein